MRSLRTILTTAIAVAILVGVGFAATVQAQTTEVRFGVLYPLTG